MPKVSVIIPCYNQGAYVDDAVESVLNQTFQDFEIIIVNDGSTDEQTNQLLANYDRPKVKVMRTDNQGLASARNNGIEAAEGAYILPLDADDKIGKEYLAKAVKVLDEDADTGIVYCLAETFGARKGRWNIPDYSLKKMLLVNLIFCTALFRKEDWEKAGRYNPNMLYGWEDWDFWLSIIELGRRVHRLPEVLFYYHVKDGSMVRSLDIDKEIYLHHQIIRNHPELFIENVRPLLEKYYKVKNSRLYIYLKKMNPFYSLIDRMFKK